MAGDDTGAPITGGCGCGAVRWRLDEPPVASAFCHCHRCQRRTGTAFGASGISAPGTFHVTKGEELIRAWKPEGGHEKHFCGECGSALFSRDPEHPDRTAPRLGSFDEDPGIRPSAHQFVDSASPWFEIPDDGLPRFAGRRPPSG
jgi:hypothetical protein